MRNDRMQIQRPMGLAAMQIDGHRSDGDVRGDQGVDNHLPARGIEQTVADKTKHRLDGGRFKHVANSL